MQPLTIEIASSSMEPTLPEGSVVEILRNECEVGDVAAFVVEKSVMVHRVIAKWHTRLGCFYVHRGDASDRSGVFAERQLLGIVGGLERKPPTGMWAHSLWLQGIAARVYAEWRRLERELAPSSAKAAP